LPGRSLDFDVLRAGLFCCRAFRDAYRQESFVETGLGVVEIDAFGQRNRSFTSGYFGLAMLGEDLVSIVDQ
jgi:hypothetical protein